MDKETFLKEIARMIEDDNIHLDSFEINAEFGETPFWLRKGYNHEKPTGHQTITIKIVNKRVAQQFMVDDTSSLIDTIQKKETPPSIDGVDL